MKIYTFKDARPPLDFDSFSRFGAQIIGGKTSAHEFGFGGVKVQKL